MTIRTIDPASIRADEDWEGNNAAFTCPACGKVFIVSGLLHRAGRPCPNSTCGKSVGHVRGGKKKDGMAYIEWEGFTQ